MVELDHTFETGKPADYNWDAILDLERVIPCVEGGKVIERDEPRRGQGRDQGEDGRDVDDVHGHGRGRRARRGGARARCCGSSRKDTGGTGLRQRRRRVRAQRRRRHDPHRRADQRQGRVDGRGRRRQRARRADQRLHDEAGERSEDGRADGHAARFARARSRPTAAPRSRTTPTVRCSAATARTTTSAWSAATCSPTAMGLEYMNKRVRDQVRALQDDQRRRLRPQGRDVTVGSARSRRKEDARFIRGQGRYVDDVQLPRDAARRGPALAGRARADRLDRHLGGAAAPEGPRGDHRRRPRGRGWRGCRRCRPTRQAVLATDKVRFQGQEVAFVIADDRYSARDALELIDVEYELLAAGGRRAARAGAGRAR